MPSLEGSKGDNCFSSRREKSGSRSGDWGPGRPSLNSVAFRLKLLFLFPRSQSSCRPRNWTIPVNCVLLRSSEDQLSRVDVWALGVYAIEMAEGLPPRAAVHPMRDLSEMQTVVTLQLYWCMRALV
ncbi:auxin-responsive protein iaa8 [Phtheirospermum japonicum]|uniref:Auxin-responsive protein iaa8 n=1 Tax=Phtheirospermum japonicum TaxID=374723 RepID=A0A830CC67_9LAMI|nr:auxin-responsive protein iaa8 [Phtheirospermum japonicum]